MPQITCVDGPLVNENHTIADHARHGDIVSLPIQLLYDPEAPVYLPYDDPRNLPVNKIAKYFYDGKNLRWLND